MYGNIYHQYTPNVSIYTSTMDPMGIRLNWGYSIHFTRDFFWTAISEYWGGCVFRQRFGRVHHDLPTHWPFQLQIFWRREVVTGCGWMSYLSWDYPKQMRIIWMTLRIQHVCGLFQVNWIMLDMFLFVQWSSYNHAIRPWSCFCLQRPFEADTWVQFFVQRWGVCVYIYICPPRACHWNKTHDIKSL